MSYDIIRVIAVIVYIPGSIAFGVWFVREYMSRFSKVSEK